jgi:hypothetical protein
MAGTGGYWRVFLRLLAGQVLGFGLLLVPLAAGCSHLQTEADGSVFQGRVVYKDFEGGFFGIVTDAGERLNPVNLPAECRQKGLRVQGTYRPLKGTVTFQMWGQPVELTQISCQEGGAPGADRD